MVIEMIIGFGAAASMGIMWYGFWGDKLYLAIFGATMIIAVFIAAFWVGNQRKAELRQCMLVEVEAGLDVETAKFVCQQREKNADLGV